MNFLLHSLLNILFSSDFTFFFAVAFVSVYFFFLYENVSQERHYNYISFIFQMATEPNYLLAIYIPYCSLSSTVAARYYCSLKLTPWWTGGVCASKMSTLPSYQSDFAVFIPFETLQRFGDRTIHMLWFRASQFMGHGSKFCCFLPHLAFSLTAKYKLILCRTHAREELCVLTNPGKSETSKSDSFSIIES